MNEKGRGFEGRKKQQTIHWSVLANFSDWRSIHTHRVREKRSHFFALWLFFVPFYIHNKTVCSEKKPQQHPTVKPFWSQQNMLKSETNMVVCGNVIKVEPRGWGKGLRKEAGMFLNWRGLLEHIILPSIDLAFFWILEKKLKKDELLQLLCIDKRLFGQLIDLCCCASFTTLFAKSGD